MEQGRPRGDLSPTTGEGTILLVEDNPAYIRLVKELLREAGLERFQLEWADLLEKGLDRLKAGDVDLVLLDLLLPDNMGTNTLEVVLENAPGTPVVVLTGIDDDELAREALDMGATDYLCKGRLDADRLARSIRYAFQNQETAVATDAPDGVVGLERLLPALADQLEQAADRLDDAAGQIDPLAEPETGQRLEADRARCRETAHALEQIVALAGGPGRRERVSLHEVIDDALVRLSGESGVGGRVRLEWSTPPTVVGDPDGLVRLFDILLSNVLSTSRAGPAEVELEAHRADERWEVRVHAPGHEMDGPDPVEGLFEEEGTSSRLTGPVARTLCEAIVVSHGGRLWIEPEAAGPGGVLCLTLPGAQTFFGPSDREPAQGGQALSRRGES